MPFHASSLAPNDIFTDIAIYANTAIAAPAVSPVGCHDPLLRPLFLTRHDSLSWNRRLSDLIQKEAMPIIIAVVRREFGPRTGRSQQYDEHDVQSEAVLQLLQRMNRLRTEWNIGSNNSIRNFQAYVKTLTRHLCARRRCRDGQSATGNPSPACYKGSLLANDGIVLCPINDDWQDSIAMRQSHAANNDLFNTVYQRQQLNTAWKEILGLSFKQRSVLLLNLRDTTGSHVLPLLQQFLQVTAAEIASALDISLCDWYQLAEMLPLEDEIIAARLGLKARDVINSRLSARRRLSRRCGEFFLK